MCLDMEILIGNQNFVIVIYPDSDSIKASGVVDGGVVLNHSGNFTTVLLDELGGPVADSAEALDDEGLTLDTFGELYAFVE